MNVNQDFLVTNATNVQLVIVNFLIACHVRVTHVEYCRHTTARATVFAKQMLPGISVTDASPVTSHWPVTISRDACSVTVSELPINALLRLSFISRWVKNLSSHLFCMVLFYRRWEYLSLNCYIMHKICRFLGVEDDRGLLGVETLYIKLTSILWGRWERWADLNGRMNLGQYRETR